MYFSGYHLFSSLVSWDTHTHTHTFPTLIFWLVKRGYVISIKYIPHHIHINDFNINTFLIIWLNSGSLVMVRPHNFIKIGFKFNDEVIYFYQVLVLFLYSNLYSNPYKIIGTKNNNLKPQLKTKNQQWY